MQTFLSLLALLLPFSAPADEPASICPALQSAKAQLDGAPKCGQAKSLQAEFQADFPAFLKECQEAEAMIGKKKLEGTELQSLRARLHKHVTPASLAAAMAGNLPPGCAKEVEPLLQFRREGVKAVGKLNQKLSE